MIMDIVVRLVVIVCFHNDEDKRVRKKEQTKVILVHPTFG
jgi:hypothetical protein